MPTDHLLYALAWISFGAGHSLLAAPAAKRRLAPLLGRGYRLAYNLFAALHLALVLWLGHRLYGDLPPFALPEAVLWIMRGMQGAGGLVLLWSFRAYDGGRFLGLTQVRRPDLPEDEDLRLDGPHRWVRHPLYLGVLLLAWGGATAPLALANAVWASLYLALGGWAEERKLLALYGERYAEYRRRVPAVVPWRRPLPRAD